MPFIGKQSSGHSKIKKSRFTATASQTDFSVVSAAGDELQVFLNGVLLKETDDYTYTTSTVTLGTGASVNDIVEVHVYQSFTIADTVDIAGDIMTGELTVPTVKLSSNVIKASDGGSTITLDTSDNVTIAGGLTATGGITNAGTISAGTIGTGVTINAGTNVSGIGQLVGMSIGGNTQGSDGNDVTIDVNKNYLCFLYGWHNTGVYSHVETWTAIGNGTSHSFSEQRSMTSYIGVGVGSGGNGTVKCTLTTPWAYGQMLVFEQGSNFDIT